MNIKLKILPSKHKKRHSRRNERGSQELTPEKRRKIEELRLARGEIVSQIESPEEPAAEIPDKTVSTPIPVEEIEEVSEKKSVQVSKEAHPEPPEDTAPPPIKETSVPLPVEESVPPPEEEALPPLEEKAVSSARKEIAPPTFGSYAKPPKKTRAQRTKKLRAPGPEKTSVPRPKKTRARRAKKMDALSKQKDEFCLKIIEWGIIGLLVFSPLPAASVPKWSGLLIQLTVFVLFGIYVFINNKPKIHPQLSSTLKWPRYLFTALFILIVFQITPLPKFLVKGLSPNTHYLRALFAPDFLRTEFMGTSMIPSYTFQKGLQLLAYFLLGYLIVKTITGRRQIFRILYVLIGMAVFQSLYGFFELYSKKPRILFYEKLEYLDCVTGTFINRNHLSGYLEMVLPLAIVLVFARTGFFDLSVARWKDKLLQFTERKAFVNILIPASIIAIALGIIFSKSRSGIFLLVLTFLLIFEFFVLYFRKSSYRKRMVFRFLKITFLIITVFALYIGIEGVIKRFSMEKFLHEYRPIFWSQTVRIIEDFPVFGSGLGTFGSMYPVYAKSTVPSRLSHAHNDYLEYLSELGILGVIFLLGGILTLLIRAFLVWRKRTHPYAKGLGLGGFISIILLLLHSITDFNLHIPANTILFTVILSLTAVTVFYQKSETGNSDEDEAKSKNKDVNPESDKEKYKEEIIEWQKFINQDEKSGLKKIILFVFAALLVLTVIAVFYSDLFFEKAKRIENNAKKLSTLKIANSAYPKNDLVHLEMGKINFGLGREPSQFEEVRIGYLHESIDQLNKSLKINPLSGYGHLILGKSLRYLNRLSYEDQDRVRNEEGVNARSSEHQELEGKAHKEFKKAAALAGPHNDIYLDVGKTFFSQWSDLSDEDKNFTAEFLKKIADRIEIEELLELMDYWEKYVRNYEVMDTILPSHLRYYRLYANFLGERSLSSQVRHRYMARAEASRFEIAKEEFRAGENAFMYRSIKKAKNSFDSCARILRRLRFYQNLTGTNLIDMDDFRDLEKSVPLMLAKCGLSEGLDFKGIQPYLVRYLKLEDDEVAVGSFEDFLKQRNLIGDEMETDFDNLGLLAFHMDLILKQRRYREIINVGHAFEQYYPRPQVEEIKSFMRVMRLVGDAFMRIHYFSDACTFYKKALSVDPINLEVLVNLRECYERVGDEVQVRDITERIDRLVFPKEMSFDNLLVKKGDGFSQSLKLDGKRGVLTLGLQRADKNVTPLISVWINNKVVWEDYLEEPSLSLPLEPLVGGNKLVITPINTDIKIQSIAYQ